MRSYPAKVLLFGEHTVLRGGRGLAVPYPRYDLRWTEGHMDNRLLQFANFLATELADAPIDTERLLTDLNEGYYLAGDIPTGYGLGSSGAVCAAVYDRYHTSVREKQSTRDLRQILSRMEGHFHGKSSGVDPLVAYLEAPLLLDAGGAAGAVELPGGWRAPFFVVDTGISRQSGELIERFLKSYAGELGGVVREGWQPAVELAIDAVIGGDADTLWTSFSLISDLQLNFYADFIPSEYYPVWDGDGAFRLKLCGAGGGGMLLGLARDREKVVSVFGERMHWL